MLLIDVFYGGLQKIHASLLVHWLQHTEIAISCCCLCGEICQPVMWAELSLCKLYILYTEETVTFRLG